jgi:hypothetical protein
MFDVVGESLWDWHDAPYKEPFLWHKKESFRGVPYINEIQEVLDVAMTATRLRNPPNVDGRLLLVSVSLLLWVVCDEEIRLC